MYLWRGQDVSAGTANVSGSLDFTTDAGFYVGTWISSAGIDGATTLAAAIVEAMSVFFRPSTFFMCNPLNKSNLFSVR